MNTKFPLLIAAGLLLTVTATQAQNNSKKYAANYPAHNSVAMNKPGNVNREEKNSRPFQKNANKAHKHTGKHHHHHHGGGHHK